MGRDPELEFYRRQLNQQRAGEGGFFWQKSFFGAKRLGKVREGEGRRRWWAEERHIVLVELTGVNRS